MDFGEILDKWDKAQKEKPKQIQKPAGSGKKLNAPSLIEKEEEKKARETRKSIPQKQKNQLKSVHVHFTKVRATIECTC